MMIGLPREGRGDEDGAGSGAGLGSGLSDAVINRHGVGKGLPAFAGGNAGDELRAVVEA